MANVGSLITASEWNALRTRLVNVLGTGSGDYGYGQITSWPTVSTSDKITAAIYTLCRNDIQKARRHQVGNATGFPTSSLPTISTGASITASSFNSLVTAVSTLEADRLNFGAASMTLYPNQVTSTKYGSWSNTIDTIFEITFESEDKMRWFFNTGGDIRLTTTHPMGSVNDNHWNRTLSRVGTVIMGAHETKRTGSVGLPLQVGFYDLTSTWQVAYDGTDIDDTYSSIPSYQYIDDVYMFARKISSTKIQLKFELNERNNSIMTVGPTCVVAINKASTYTNNPTIPLPQTSIIKNW